MLDNIEPVGNLQSFARAAARNFESRTVNAKLVDEFIAQGWQIAKTNVSTTRLIRPKNHGKSLEDRVWTLLYRMRFPYLSGEGGGSLTINPKDPASPKTNIDVVGIDTELAVAIECKSSEKPAKRPTFMEEVGKHALIREPFSNALRRDFPSEAKRQTVLAMFLSKILLSENDRTRTKEANIVIFDEADLDYYETLVNHLGSAAKYQFFADMVPGKEVPGLRIRVPAMRFKMGGQHCYSFTLSPEYLLKICYVSHRSKGKASDVDAYQRMVAKSRLKKIRDYISDNGYFPTSIVVNLDNKRLTFERVKQTQEDDALMGWLEIRPAYKSAWIIDGQHRLFGYSGHERAAKARLSVLAFAGLKPSDQARLFIDINSKQKKVPQILLQTLIAELNWDAEDPNVQVGAIISKAIQVLDRDAESPFFGRIQTSEESKDSKRCITITSLHFAIDRAKLYIAKEKQGHIVNYGPLWAGESFKTLDRTTYILNKWFSLIRNSAPDWWEKGSESGGGLAMNDGVSTCLAVLRSAFDHLFDQGKKLVEFDDEDLFELIKQYGDALANYLGSLSEDDRKRFRDLRGTQGIVARTRKCQKAIRDSLPSFNPEGLERYLEEEKAQTNSKAKEVIDRIERSLQQVVLEELKREFGPTDSGWWIEGIPKTIRLEVTQRFEEDDGKRGSKEHYFYLVHYQKIAKENWELFQDVLSFGKKGVGKEKGTSWMNDLNEKRKMISHASSASSLSVADLFQLQEYEQKLNQQLAARSTIEPEESEAEN